MSLLDYQKSHVKALINAFEYSNTAIDSSDTGTGKTYCACAVAQMLSLQPFVICPKSVISNWVKVMKEFQVDSYGISNYESIKNLTWYNGADGKKERCPFLTYIDETYTWDLPSNCLVILDEAHRCKNKKTQNAQMVMALKGGKNKVMLLSATIADKPKFFGVFSYLLDFIPNVKLHNIFLKKLRAINGEKPVMYLLHKRVFPRHGSRLKIADLGDKFPKNKIIADAYSMGEKIEKEIQEQYEYINIVSTEAKKLGEMANIRLVQIIRARQQIEALKLATMIELAKDHLDNDLSVVIFVNFTDSLSILAAELNTNCTIHGEQTLVERDRAIDLFQTNRERIIICQIQSGGVGISLHDVHGGHQRVSIISPSWSAQDLVQVLGRIHRAGSKTPALQKIVYCSNTIEEEICNLVQVKLINYSQLNDGESDTKIKLGTESDP